MIAASDIIGGVYGAWRLARRDPKGLIWFDESVEGVWRSFAGPALVLPAFLILRALDGNFDDELIRSLVVELIAFVMGCVAFPLAVVHISQGLDRAQFCNRYIVAYNWSAVIQMAVLLPMGLLLHGFPGAGLAPLNLAVTIVLLVYQAYIAHVALKIAPFSAGMLVVLDLMIGAMIQMSANRLLG